MTDTIVRARVVRRRPRARIVAAVVVLVLAAAGLTTTFVVRHLDGGYGPLTVGGASGFGPDGVVAADDGSTRRLVTAGAATASVFSSLTNSGTHSVVVTSVARTDIVRSGRWADYPDPGGVVFGRGTRWRHFPVTVAAGREILVRLDIRRPAHCQDRPIRPGTGEMYDGSYEVRWRSLLSDHVTTVGAASADSRQIQVC